MQKQSLLIHFSKKIVSHRYFTRIIITLILFNALLVGLETYPALRHEYGSLFHVLDVILLWIFTLEILTRFLATTPKKDFFKGGWNWFDTIIVLSSHIFVGGHFITVLRILRVLRVLRAISVIPSLRRLVDALMLTIPALGNILILMSIIFYIFAVLGTMLFANVAPEYFANLQLSMLTLFQIVTLDSWGSGVMRPILVDIPWAWTYFIAFVLVGTFIIFNLFIGVIVNNVEKANEDEVKDKVKEKEEAAQKQMDSLHEELKEIKQYLKSIEKQNRSS
ncbi:cation transporter [Alkalihalobacillus alcalophilus ATCC 27647 = CGMCC 1.3604]|uniref:Cation transporter n=1 Tax=Alkalihalobacillus alcalophilus ATCC 27647 = CGMCC 1.3604 TaxID=1218173 RepID=J8TM36_ALKAL|nr:ion transporter [Alkalihalobacillus alcalophilus]AFV25941.1 potassium ion channel transporter [Alkalihalobacillus alcalophilus ATCC 27647 = CGMCC 1.3604]KGA97090.1 voltage-gated sodium channel [Alkalihalobacillus alcalophilus ATCC 27647 = CGMCC 1.3604]MED1563060.1 ion transporter [Alkalihalobacillus alcalophilus]THG88991.1 cation transporter [Alkalihalobacillus alcalophilus ATCC 27647 = CGMCC 1.3604]